MKYKLSETPLKLREYGRNIQMMVEEAKSIEDREKRTAHVREIMRIMATLVPQNREGDWRQKLWDQLCFLADYNLDIESEYPMPDPKIMNSRPTERLAYNKATSRFRQYGQNVQRMIEEAGKTEDPEKRKALISLVANIMRINIGSSEKDLNLETMVLEHLKEICRGKVEFDPAEVQFYKSFALRSVPRNVSTTAGIQKRVKKKKKKK